MEKYIYPDKGQWRALTERVTTDDPAIEARVAGILARIKAGGDTALKETIREIDGYLPGTLRVSREEIDRAVASMPRRISEAMAEAKANIEKFHAAQRFDEIRVETTPGVVCAQRAVPIESVGLYIPGGTAPLFSTVLMLAVPAKIAGCRRVMMCTPADSQGNVAPAVLAAAALCGVDEIYKAGGAQAIAAMAYGTETIARVDKIFGPGNRYVSKAKQMVASQGVQIDMLAGPSEVLVIADSSAAPSYVAADLLSQAEHGRDSQAMLVCHDETFADTVIEEVGRQLALLPRRDIAEASLGQSRVVVLRDLDECLRFSNAYAPEHLILSVEHPWEAAARVTAAGSVFVGNYSPESAGDYASGTNHTLPTSGYARATGGVNLDSYMRKITYQELTRDGLRALSGAITTMARAEGLDAHARAVEIRLGQ